MDYKIGSIKQMNTAVLSEILQNRFPKFDDSIVNWKFKGKEINAKLLEEKIIKNYKNKENNKSKTEGNYSDWIDIFDAGLNKIKLLNKLPIVFFSGGKDSTFVASRLVQNNIKALYFSFITNNNEKKIINELADKLKIKIYFAKEHLEFLDLEIILKNIKEPILDPAGLSILLLFDICLRNNLKFSDLVFIDGLGNDPYMGYPPSKRELKKLFFQKCFNRIKIHKVISIKTWNSMGKYGDLLRPDYTYNFSGSNIKLRNYNEQISFYKKYQIHNNIILERALLRGIHYDFGCGIHKSILYLNACDSDSRVIFPFLNSNLIDYFEKRKIIDFNFSTLVNKLSIRKYLNENLNFDKISTKKGIFKPSYLDFIFQTDQQNLAKKMKLDLSNLRKIQQSDFYFWSKFVINNKLADLF
tara:strand:- start:2379 stop:3617 length:1239 start_codon:yes stop_codon:yes gene_type:complete